MGLLPMAAAPIFDICTPLRGGTIEPWRKARLPGGHTGRPYGKTKSVAWGGLHGRPCRTAASDAPPPTAPAVGARMARPCPRNHRPGRYRTGFRGICNPPLRHGRGMVPRRTASDPGAGGPMWASAPTRRNHRTLAQSNGFRAAIQAAPTGKQKAWRRGGLYGRPCRTAALHAPSRNAASPDA